MPEPDEYKLNCANYKVQNMKTDEKLSLTIIEIFLKVSYAWTVTHSSMKQGN